MRGRARREVHPFDKVANKVSERVPGVSRTNPRLFSINPSGWGLRPSVSPGVVVEHLRIAGTNSNPSRGSPRPAFTGFLRMALVLAFSDHCGVRLWFRALSPASDFHSAAAE